MTGWSAGRPTGPSSSARSPSNGSADPGGVRPDDGARPSPDSVDLPVEVVSRNTGGGRIGRGRPGVVLVPVGDELRFLPPKKASEVLEGESEAVRTGLGNGSGTVRRAREVR